MVEVIYGTRVSPFTGEVEIGKGRIVIFQNEFTELDKNINPADIDVRVFAPEDLLRRIEEATGKKHDPDFFMPCLLFKESNTEHIIEILKKIIPEIELINSDDDKIFAEKLA